MYVRINVEYVLPDTLGNEVISLCLLFRYCSRKFLLELMTVNKLDFELIGPFRPLVEYQRLALPCRKLFERHETRSRSFSPEERKF